jgi:hypothetical protein
MPVLNLKYDMIMLIGKLTLQYVVKFAIGAIWHSEQACQWSQSRIHSDILKKSV